jgi:hypothetical protein
LIVLRLLGYRPIGAAWHCATPLVWMELVVSESTVKTHLLQIYSQLKVRDRAAAMRVAFEKRNSLTPENAWHLGSRC